MKKSDKKVTVKDIANSLISFNPKVPLSFIVAVRKVIKNK